MEVAVYNKEGKKTTKKVKLSDKIFGIAPNDHAIYLDVKQYLANQRQGTHKAKERGEIAGSTRKIRRQKGSGTARFGSIKNPLFHGGGRIFGPRPRDYSQKVNRSVKKLARKSALTYKAKDEHIKVLEDLKFETPKTREYAQLLANLELDGDKTLLVLKDSDKNVYLSARNIYGAKVTTVNELNTYDLLDATNILLSESSVKEIENLLG